MAHDRDDRSAPQFLNAAAPGATLPGYPLTALQGGMLYHEIRGLRGVDLEQIVCRTPESIDVKAFSRALHWLTEQHPVLRTRFVWDTDDEPRQEIVDGVSPAVRVVDRGDLPADERTLDFQRLLLADRNAGLSLAAAPLIRAWFRVRGGPRRWARG